MTMTLNYVNNFKVLPMNGDDNSGLMLCKLTSHNPDRNPIWAHVECIWERPYGHAYIGPIWVTYGQAHMGTSILDPNGTQIAIPYGHMWNVYGNAHSTGSSI